MTQSSLVQGVGVELVNLSKHYGEFIAADRVNLDISPGEFVTFLGPSGSGKTTTLMMIAGFTIPTQGDVRLDQKSIVKVPVHQRNIGMVFQNYALFPHLSVARNVAFPLEMRKHPRAEIGERVKKALQLVRLEQFGDRRPSQLSGGQQQRVALARAMVYEPPLLLLDEPLGALDAKLREEMKFELKQLHHKVGATILFVTHDQEEALTLSNRIAVFDQGALAQVGTPSELYREPRNRFVADFIGETNLLEGPVESIDGSCCRVEIAEGVVMTGRLREGFERPQKRAVYTLRLEEIVFGDEAAGLANQFDGTVEEYLYVGNAIKYLVRLSPDLTVTAKVADQGHSRVIEPGQKILVGWHENAALLVEADEVQKSG